MTFWKVAFLAAATIAGAALYSLNRHLDVYHRQAFDLEVARARNERLYEMAAMYAMGNKALGEALSDEVAKKPTRWGRRY